MTVIPPPLLNIRHLLPVLDLGGQVALSPLVPILLKVRSYDTPLNNTKKKNYPVDWFLWVKLTKCLISNEVYRIFLVESRFKNHFRRLKLIATTDLNTSVSRFFSSLILKAVDQNKIHTATVYFSLLNTPVIVRSLVFNNKSGRPNDTFTTAS